MNNCHDQLLIHDIQNKYKHHVDAHQDDNKDFALPKRPAQMDCVCDGMAKGVVWGLAGEKLPKQDMFPFESSCICW